MAALPPLATLELPPVAAAPAAPPVPGVPPVAGLPLLPLLLPPLPVAASELELVPPFEHPRAMSAAALSQRLKRTPERHHGGHFGFV